MPLYDGDRHCEKGYWRLLHLEEDGSYYEPNLSHVGIFECDGCEAQARA